MATSNINFTITKPSLGYDITDNVLAPSEIVTKSDVNKLNITLVGFDNPTSLTVDLVFPNGTIQKDLHLISTVENPNMFYRVLNDIYDMISNINISRKIYNNVYPNRNYEQEKKYISINFSFEKLQILKKIIQITDAKIVLSLGKLVDILILFQLIFLSLK